MGYTMNENTEIFIYTATAAAAGAVGAVLVVMVVALFNRIRWRLLKRHLSEADATKEGRELADAHRIRATLNGETDD